jgi:N-acetylglutamate synthase-like GNAT family acetyltransferase
MKKASRQYSPGKPSNLNKMFLSPEDIEIKYLSDDPEIISTLARWTYEEWGHLVPGRTLETAHEKVRQSLGPSKIPLTLVASLNGELVGTAGIDTADMSTHPELSPWMVSVYVDPAHRMKGIGTVLCNRIKDEFARLGIKTAYLFTPDQENYYTRLGWKTFLKEEYREEQVTIMKLNLD